MTRCSKQSLNARGARLNLETLDRRDMPSANITWVQDYLFTGHIEVTGNSTADVVTVSYRANGPGNSDDQLVVTRKYGTNSSETESFYAYLNAGGISISHISRVVATLKDGANQFTNNTSYKSEVTGGAFADVFKGGSGDDFFDGKGGGDTLYGHSGRDTLYGDSGNDTLWGGAQNDGLFGGTGVDHLYGEGGGDRFLIPALAGTAAIPMDEQGIDARVYFANGSAQSAQGVDWHGGAWSEDDIRKIDVALDALMRCTGNTTLLENADGDPLKFYRLGVPKSDTSVLAWNSASESITLTQRAFNAGNNWLTETVFHEVGHNWDEQDENPYVNEFRALSGWLPFTTAGAVTLYQTGLYNLSGDGMWIYWKAFANNFTRDYARTNPKEDFAESFAAEMMDFAGLPFQGAPATWGGPSAITNKLAVVDEFLNLVTVPVG